MSQCVHEETLHRARNAVVAVRAGLSHLVLSRDTNEEISRLENFYDFDRLRDEDGDCVVCQNDYEAILEAKGEDYEFVGVEYLQLTNVRQKLWKSSLYSISLVWGK